MARKRYGTLLAGHAKVWPHCSWGSTPGAWRSERLENDEDAGAVSLDGAFRLLLLGHGLTVTSG